MLVAVLWVGVVVAQPTMAAEPSLIQQRVQEVVQQRQATRLATESGQVQQFVDPSQKPVPIQPPKPKYTPEVWLKWQAGPITLWTLDGQWYLSVWSKAYPELR